MISIFGQKKHGRVGAFGEWKLIYSLCKDKEGYLHKDTVRAIYDGSVFVKLEQERKQAKELEKKK
jgi:peroxygenase